MIATEDQARAFVAARCEPADMARLDLFVAALAKANLTQNLVSRASLDRVWVRHIADSAQLLDHVADAQGDWLDLGTGAGLPGLVIAIMRPDRPVHLVESRTLRIRWLSDMAEQLNCRNCRVLGADLRKVSTFSAGVISARAFAPLDRLVALSARFSTSETRWLLPKGRSAAKEVAGLPKQLRGVFHVEQSLTDAEAGIIVGHGRMESAA